MLCNKCNNNVMVVYKDKDNKEYKCELCYYGNESSKKESKKLSKTKKRVG